MYAMRWRWWDGFTFVKETGQKGRRKGKRLPISSNHVAWRLHLVKLLFRCMLGAFVQWWSCILLLSSQHTSCCYFRSSHMQKNGKKLSYTYVTFLWMIGTRGDWNSCVSGYWFMWWVLGTNVTLFTVKCTAFHFYVIWYFGQEVEIGL